MVLKVIDAARLSNRALGQLADPRRARQTSPSLRLSAWRELELRTVGLDFDNSFKVIETAARDRGVVRYGEIAEASGAPWDKVSGRIEGHLRRLAVYARDRGWPVPSAMVIRETVETGADRPQPLNGLLEVGKALGYPSPETIPFLREQHEKLTTWARTKA